jgi:hypothetical protein
MIIQFKINIANIIIDNLRFLNCYLKQLNYIKKSENKFYFSLSLLLIFFFINYKSYSQELSTSINVHLPIMLKSLEYDRNLKTNSSEKIKIGILYQENFRTSLNNKNQIFKFIKDNRINSILSTEVEFISINFNNFEQLIEIVSKESFKVVYITPLKTINIELLIKLLTENKILSMSGVSEYLKFKLPFTVDIIGDRPKIIIDLNNSRKAGADFKANLLKLAKIINTNE